MAIALQQLVNEHRSPDGWITLPASDAVRFLETAVAKAVAKALDAANATADDLRHLVIPRLATWDPNTGGDGAAKRIVAPGKRLFEGDRVNLRPLAEALVAQRLLIRSSSAAGAIYEVAHEALFRVNPLHALIFDRVRSSNSNACC